MCFQKWRCLLLPAPTVNTEPGSTFEVAPRRKCQTNLNFAPPILLFKSLCAYDQLARNFLELKIFVCASAFFFLFGPPPPFLANATGVKEVPAYSPAKILPRIVAQDKETNSVVI